MAANDLARAASAALAAAPTWSSRCRWSSNLGWKFKAQASLALFDSRSYMLIFNWDYCLPPAPSVHVKAWKLLWYVKPVKQTTQRPIVILPHFREFFQAQHLGYRDCEAIPSAKLVVFLQEAEHRLGQRCQCLGFNNLASYFHTTCNGRRTAWIWQVAPNNM